MDWRGEPIAPPLPDPIFAAIERHLAARAACLGLDDGKDKDGYEATHDRRIETLEAVESTKPSTVAGLFALARHMKSYLDEDAGGDNIDEAICSGPAFVALINACLGLHEARYPGMDRDWAMAAVYHPGFIPSPQHQPAGLLRLDYAIPQEAAYLLALAEAEFERRRQVYVGFHDPSVWPRVAAEIRRDMRMDALAIVAAPAASKVPAAPSGGDPVFAAIQAHADARVAFSATVNAQDRAWVRQNGGDASDEAMAPADAAYEAASEAEKQAWTALFQIRPTTLPGVLALTRHAQQFAPGNDGLTGAPDIEDVFGAIADGLQDLIPEPLAE